MNVTIDMMLLFVTIIGLFVTILIALISGVWAILWKIANIDKNKVDHTVCKIRRDDCDCWEKFRQLEKQLGLKKVTAFILLGLMFLLLTGCVNTSLVDSYEAYLNTAGKEHQEYVKAGKYPDGTPMSQGDKTARILNYQASRKVITKAREHAESWNPFGGD
jgi:hypothetical protein